MAESSDHSLIDPDRQGVHVPFQFSVADHASRASIPASMLSDGASKLLLQRSDFSIWMPSSLSPTPEYIRAGGGVQSETFFVTASAEGGWDNASFPLWQAPINASISLSQVNVDVMGATIGTDDPLVRFNLHKRDWGDLNQGNSDAQLLNGQQSAPSGGSQFTSFATSVMEPKSHLVFTTDSPGASGAVSSLALTMYYIIK